MIERLARYVSVRSLSREEGALAGVVAADLSAAGLIVHRRGNNLWCEIGDAPRPRLLLNSHLDTVPPGDGWSHDPWTPRITGGSLSGLGANDAKGCVTAMIECVLNLKDALQRGESLGGTIVLALTAEEEISGNGLSATLPDLGPIDAALVGEPTGLTPMIAQRGLLIVMGIARGRTGHPAHTPPDAADNAVLNAAADLSRLGEFDWGPVHPLLGRTHAHVTQIRGGVARNVIPDACEFSLDIRSTTAETHDALFARLQRQLRSDLRIHSKRLVPVETAATEPIVAACAAASGLDAAGSAAMSDMVFLAGVPSVKIGPGESRRSHTPNEYIREIELSAGAAVYENAARGYFARIAESLCDGASVCHGQAYSPDRATTSMPPQRPVAAGAS